MGVALPAETVRQARAHNPQTQTGRARRDQTRPQQRTPRSAQQQDQAALTPRLRIPLRKRTDRDDLPLLRRNPDRAPAPMSHPQSTRRAPNSGCASKSARSCSHADRKRERRSLGDADNLRRDRREATRAAPDPVDRASRNSEVRCDLCDRAITSVVRFAHELHLTGCELRPLFAGAASSSVS